MANQLGSADICAAWWRWESDDLTADSRNNFTLTAIGTPTANTTIKREGASSVALNGTQGFSLDINTTSTFPLRPWAATPKFSFSLWCYPTDFITTARTILLYRTDTGNALHVYHDVSGLSVKWNEDHGLQEHWQTGWQITPQTWGYVAIAYDPIRRHFVIHLYLPHRGTWNCRYFLPRQELMLSNGVLCIGYNPTGNGWLGNLDEAICWKQPVSTETLLQASYGVYGTDVQAQFYTGDLTYPGFTWNRTYWQ